MNLFIKMLAWVVLTGMVMAATISIIEVTTLLSSEAEVISN